MRDLGFLIANICIREILDGLITHNKWHTSMGCAPVDVVPADVHVASGLNDSGLHKR